MPLAEEVELHEHTARSKAVRAELASLLTEDGWTPGRLDDDDGLADLGVDSLALAVLVTRLEDVLGVDPFEEFEHSRLPQTVGELVALYTDQKPP